MGCQGFHGIRSILGDQAGLVLICREQHVVQQVNIGIATKGVVQRVVRVVHGDGCAVKSAVR